MNIKRIRKQLKGGADIYDFPIEKMRPRQARKLAALFTRLGGKLVR